MLKICRYCNNKFETKTKAVFCPGPHYHICPVCKKEFEITIRQVKQIVYENLACYCSKKCKQIGTTNTNMNKYGTKSPSQNKEVLEKIQNTHLLRYGTTLGKCKESHIKRVNNIKNKNNGKYFLEESIKKAKQTRYNKNNGNYFSKESIRHNREHQPLYKQINLNNIDINKSKKNLCKELNCSYKTLQKHLMLSDIYLTNRIYINKSDLQNLLNKNINIKDISNMYKCSTTTIYNKIKQFNIELSDEYIANQKINRVLNITLKIQQKYNRLWYSQTNISDETVTILSNRDNLYNFVLGKYYIDCCNELNICANTLYNYLTKYDIPYSIMKHGNYSNLQQDIYNEISKIYDGYIEQNNRKILAPLEIDIYIPELKFGIEVNGNYWHSVHKVPKDYHLLKSQKAQEKGIFLYHIYEFEWVNRKQQILQQINNLIGKTKKIHSNNCYIKLVNSDECAHFLQNNHRQGYCNSSINIGLYTKKNIKGLSANTLVSVMCFSKSIRDTKYDYELVRFCTYNGYTVYEAGSTLFNYFLNNYNCKSILSYSDIGTTTGKLYDILGFINIGNVKGSYVWVNKTKVFNREKCKKDNLKKLLLDNNIDLNKTEKQIMEEHGYLQIFNAGRRKHVYIK